MSNVPLPEPDAVSGHNDNYGEKCWTRKRVKKYGDARAQAEVEQLQVEIARLKLACSKMNDDVCQTLGKALGYPWFKDDQANFSGADESNGVCVGDHVAESIAAEAATKIERLVNALRRLDGILAGKEDEEQIDAYAHAQGYIDELLREYDGEKRDE